MATPGAWELFETWCEDQDERTGPADWTTIVHFIRDLAREGVAVGDVEQLT